MVSFFFAKDERESSSFTWKKSSRGSGNNLPIKDGDFRLSVSNPNQSFRPLPTCIDEYGA
jgi:hypothetical protein